MITTKMKKEIEQIVEHVFGDARINFDTITRMGGLTNYNYRININGEDYALRFPGDGTENMINRKNEYISTKLACELDIEPELLYFNQANGVKVERYIEDAVTMNPSLVKTEENLKLIANLFQRLHHCKQDTGVIFDVFEMIEEYEQLIQTSKISLYDDYDVTKAKLDSYRSELAQLQIQKVPCHNDPLCENFVRSSDRMYLIDWEYAGMNDAMWDLADVAIEANLTSEQEDFLLREYLGKEVDVLCKRRLQINKVCLDFLWTLWGKARSLYDPELEEYAYLRYQRTKVNMIALEQIK